MNKIHHKLSTAITIALSISALSACSPAANIASTDASTSKTAVVSATATNSHTMQTSADYLQREVKDDVFYFVMPDRFHNANPANDMGAPEGSISHGGLDKTSKWAFHGGDMQGLEEKLDYLQNLGITAIWMTPILRNKAIQKDGFGHHGYWVVDFTQIDPHFGSNDDLKSLIDAAHARGMKIFFDIITNHTADVIRYKECHNAEGKFIDAQQKGCEYKSKAQIASGDTYTPFLLDAEKDVKHPAWLNDPQYYNNQGDSFWQGESAVYGDFAGLDDLNTADPRVLDGMIDIFKDIITEFKPDGFRIDTVKHVDLSFWQSFGPAIEQHAIQMGIPKFHIFGEVYDGNPAGLSKYTTAGKLPSVLDFGFHFNLKDSVFSGQDVDRIGTLFDNDDYYRDADSSPDMLMNFLGNHDAGRAGYFIEQGFADASEEEKLQRSKLAHAFMYLSRGVPVVYYGDEQGFTGDGGDVDARENMDASFVEVYNDNNLLGTDSTTAQDNFDTSHPLYLELARLAEIRKMHPALRHGVHQNRMINNDKRIVAFSRIVQESLDNTGTSEALETSAQREYLAVFNLDTQAQSIELEQSGRSYTLVAQSAYAQGAEPKLNAQDNTLTMQLAPLSFQLYKADQALRPAEVTALKIADVYEENERSFIPVELSFADPKQLNSVSIEFYLTDQNGKQRLIASDNTSPYRAVVMPNDLVGMRSVEVKVRNANGDKLELSKAL